MILKALFLWCECRVLMFVNAWLRLIYYRSSCKRIMNQHGYIYFLSNDTWFKQGRTFKGWCVRKEYTDKTLHLMLDAARKEDAWRVNHV